MFSYRSHCVGKRCGHRWNETFHLDHRWLHQIGPLDLFLSCWISNYGCNGVHCIHRYWLYHSPKHKSLDSTFQKNIFTILTRINLTDFSPLRCLLWIFAWCLDKKWQQGITFQFEAPWQCQCKLERKSKSRNTKSESTPTPTIWWC